ncbi:ankyrin [Lophiostoma macrostomum CBS 122681]|uniref:Ankyrin n=1 Tax=Lophiostoma macrostomum CBS 122681 TaxID=1314788 RepID=A0A6A6T2N1_9PLEO|nr:ankyrin [Lophiostoma macrostomum CBS 122681]
MDPISVATACVAVTRAAVSTATEVRNVIDKLKDVPNVVRSPHTQLQLTDSTTSRLHGWLQKESDILTAGEAEFLHRSLSGCHVLMIRIRQHVDTSKGNKLTSLLRKMKHVWNETALKEDQERLKSQLDAQQFLIAILNLPRPQRSQARQNKDMQSILIRAQDNATLYAGREDDEGGDTFEDELANSDAYKTAFASMMGKQKAKTPKSPLSKSFAKSLRSLSISGSSFSDSSSTVLGLAAFHGDNGRVQTLLDGGALVDFVDDQKRTALIRAVEGGHVETVRLILDQCPRLNVTDAKGHTALIRSVINQNKPITDLLLQYNASTEKRDQLDRTALHHAVEGHESIAALLLSKGAVVDAKDNYGYTPLHLCVRSGDDCTSLVKVLLEAGADVEATRRKGSRLGEAIKYHTVGSSEHDDPSMDEYPLHMAVRSHNLPMVKLLLDTGAYTENRGIY